MTDKGDGGDNAPAASPGHRLAVLRQQRGEQEEFPFAVVAGQALTELPRDLYIPPEALEVFLEAFEGPLDLLLYLIRRQNLDILDIQVAEITRQYMRYVELMKALQFELAAEYLVMAAMLAEIKSRMLLPRPESEEDEAEDPRAELIRRLQEYERFRTAAQELDELPRVEREIFPAQASGPEWTPPQEQPQVELRELVVALSEVLARAEMYRSHAIRFETLSTRERMGELLRRLSHERGFVAFHDLYRIEEGRRGVVVTFLALLELVKESLVEVVQNAPFAPIHVRARVQELSGGAQHDPG